MNGPLVINVLSMASGNTGAPSKVKSLSSSSFTLQPPGDASQNNLYAFWQSADSGLSWYNSHFDGLTSRPRVAAAVWIIL